MLVIPPPRFQKRRVQPKIRPLLPASASYQPGVSVTMRFNQPIDISAIALNSFQLNDGPAAKLYGAEAATLVDGFTVKLTLIFITAIPGPSITLDVDDANGLRSVEAAQIWNGVSELSLPYP